MAKVPKAKRNSGVSSKPTPLAKRVAEPVATRPLWNLSTGWSVAIGLALLGGVLAALRWHFLDIPLERDESAYAYIGKQSWMARYPIAMFMR
ncbi:MAG: hypothetical protein IPM81_19080 [Saprospirales bacterium]|nr:hypothetical protein [Saprospirales bacterium]